MMKVGTKVNDLRKWTPELIYERLQQEAESDPTILCLKQETAKCIKSFMGCGWTYAFQKLKELESEYEFKTYGRREEWNYTKNLLEQVNIKHVKGHWKENRMYYSAVGYIFWCKKMNKELDLVGWKERYLIKLKNGKIKGKV